MSDNFWERYKRATKIEVACFIVMLVGWIGLAFVPSSMQFAGLWVACWFAGSQIWKLWYITRKGARK